MKKFKATTAKKPFMIRIDNKDVDLHNISDEQAEKLYKGGSKLVQPVSDKAPKTKL